ncbi:MAG: HAD family phosphatase [Chloroflexota bacterium]
MIKAVIFDYGEVLTNSDNPVESAQRRRALGRRLGLSEHEVWPYLFQGEPARKWMTGQYSWDQYWNAVLPPRGVTDPQEIASFHKSVWPRDSKINPEMRAILKELNGRYKIGLLSNASWPEAELREILERNQILHYFDTVISSSSEGVVKPDPAIFKVALQRLSVQAEEALFVDDLAKFTDSAAAMGFYTFTFTNASDFRLHLKNLQIIPS